jgi:formate dehydrogenase subunit delta
MSDSLDRLIYMANQIARNLATTADPAATTADHIARFWDPRMRTILFEHLAAGGAGLDLVACAAMSRLCGGDRPGSQMVGNDFNAAHDSGRSDAG